MINEEVMLNIQENEEATINEVENIDGVLNIENIDDEEGTLYIEEDIPEEIINMFKKDVSE